MSELTCIDKLTGIESSCRLPRAAPAKAIAVAAIALGLGVACALTGGPAMADTQVHGKPQAVGLTAQNATVEEILVALSNEFDVQFRSSADLDKRLTGSYEGTLQQVVSHILRGYDFVVKSGDSGVEITLLGSGKTMRLVGGAPVPKTVERRANLAVPAPTDDSAPPPMPVATPGAPTATMKIAEGPAPAPGPVPAASGAAPIPGSGSGAFPSPQAPGDAPAPVPLIPGASGVLPSPSAAPPVPIPPSPSPPVPPRAR